MNIEMISTGDEVLCGYITDTNASFLSSELLNIGIKIHRRTTVGDSLSELMEIFKERAQKADVVIVNGGMGPTSDDLSRQAAAAVANAELERRPELVEKMEQWFKSRNRQMPDSNLVQADLPKGAEIIPNDIGTACGFSLKIGQAIFIFTPGVPSEFKKMVTEQIIPFLKKNYPVQAHSKVKLFYSFGIGESTLGTLLSQEKWPENIVLGYRVDNPYIEIKLISENAEKTDFAKAEELLMQKAGNYIISSESFSFYHEIQEGLQKRPLVIEDSLTRGTIFYLLRNHCEAIGAIGQKSNVTDSNAIVLSIEQALTEARDVIITIRDNKTNYELRRKLHFAIAPNRLAIYSSFMALDMLRRYLYNKNPQIEYEYVKTITDLS